jgi:hypothetical protein
MKQSNYTHKIRHTFGENQEFPDNAKKIINGYHEAARMAAKTAKIAIHEGTVESLLLAQWWETVTETIEACLRALIRPEDHELGEDNNFFMPEPHELHVESNIKRK